MNPGRPESLDAAEIAVQRALPVRLLIGLIAIYRYAISPVLGPHCRYYPSCSEYAQQALGRHGIYLGAGLSLKRLCRCHPWKPGGYDPVP